jgi:hypothetical protein
VSRQSLNIPLKEGQVAPGDLLLTLAFKSDGDVFDYRKLKTFSGILGRIHD